MHNIENIIFDLGGVILNIDNKRTADDFVQLGAKDFSHYFGHGFAASFFKDYEIGKISDKEFISSLKKMLPEHLPDQAVIQAWNAMLLDFPPERIDLLHVLGKKYRIFLFSNTNSLHMESVHEIYRNTFARSGLDQLFEKAYYSHILGMRKPDPESFEYIIRENNLNPGLTLFVDDALVNINGAEAAGLKGLYLAKGITIMDFKW